MCFIIRFKAVSCFDLEIRTSIFCLYVTKDVFMTHGMKFTALACSLFAAFGLSACGGGGGGTAATSTGTNATPSSVTGSGDASVCFNPALWATAGTTTHVVSQETYSDGTSPNTITEDSTTLAGQIFNGSPATEIDRSRTSVTTGSTGGGATTSSSKEYYSVDVPNTTLYQLGSQETRPGSFGTTITTTSTDTPALPLRFNLTAGGSYQTSTTETTPSSTTPGVNNVSTISGPITFVGIESVTIPAGTFQACHMVFGPTHYQDSNGSNYSNTLDAWLGVGNGLVLKSHLVDASVGNVDSVVTSASINGTPITP